MVDKTKILAVVVTYNRKALLEECLSALIGQSYTDFDILVVDNASADGTDAYVKKLDDKRIIYFNTGANWGAAVGFTYGINRAIISGYEFCWTMDDDTIPDKFALESNIEKAELLGSDFSFISSLIKWTDGNVCPFNIPTFSYPLWRNTKALELSLLPVSSASYTSCFINVSIAKQVGLPIKEYFIYADDVEFTKRLSLMGQGYLNLESIAVHKMSSLGNSSVWNCDRERITRWRYAYRNTLCTAKRENGKAVIRCLFDDLKAFILILLRARNLKMMRLSIVFKGIKDGMRFNPPIIKEYNEDFFAGMKKPE